MVFLPFTPPVGASPNVADTAAIYVTTDGSNSNDGLTWETAKLTIAAAIAALPTVGGLQVGTVQLGAGNFNVASGGSPAINLTATQCITLQGLALTEAYSGGTAPVYLTSITDTGTGDTIHQTGSASITQFSLIRNIAFTTTTAANGYVGTNVAGQQITACTFDGYSVFGITLNNQLGMPLFGVAATRCGNAGASTPAGGVYFKTTPNYGTQMDQCGAQSCIGFGVYCSGGINFNCIGSVFQGTVASAAARSGAGVFVGGIGNGTGPYTFYSCWHEKNATYGFDSNQTAILTQFFGCNFAGDGVQIAGVNAAGQTLIDGCNFSNHTGESVNNANQQPVAWRGCGTTDAVFINNGGGIFGTVGQLSAQMAGTCFMQSNQSFWPQPLAVNGAVTFYPGLGQYQVITLTANATSSSVDTAIFPAAIGQTMTICWIQGAGGAHTYAWPANCKFAAGTAPVASAIAGYEDNVTFHWNGTNWIETARSIGVH
jgi:hypothetical protein